MASHLPRPLAVPRVVSRRAALAGVGLGGALAVLTSSLRPARAVTAPSTAAGGVRSIALSTGGRGLLSTGSAVRTLSARVDGGSMVGVSFPRGTRATSVSLRVTRAGRPAGDWIELALGDSAPDPHADEPEVTASDPVWTGELGPGATIEVRLPAEDAAHARLEVVEPGEHPQAAVTAAGAVFFKGAASATPAVARTADLKAGGSLRPTINSRADWGADESLRRTKASYSGTLKAAVVHHTADGGSYTADEVPSVIRGMYRYHTQTLGWNDLGYNFVVDRFGGIWEGRAGGIDEAVVGAHAGGFNTETFGVSMMGDFTSVAPTDATLQSVAAVIAWKFSLYGLAADAPAQLTSAGGGTARFPAGQTAQLRTINGHRDVGFTACPGKVGYTKMDDIRGRVAALLDSAPAPVSPIDAKYVAVDGATLLGDPTSDEGDALRGGRFRHYQKGSIYHLPALGAFVVRGSHVEKYAASGWEWSALGFPISDTADVPGGVGSMTHFENGSIYRRAGSDPHAVMGDIRTAWAAMGWETSALGFPISDEYDVPGGRASNFEGGQLRWNASTRKVRKVS